MKKKTYQQPEMQVVKLEQADIICTSTVLQNEVYIEEDDVTEDWFFNN